MVQLQQGLSPFYGELWPSGIAGPPPPTLASCWMSAVLGGAQLGATWLFLAEAVPKEGGSRASSQLPGPRRGPEWYPTVSPTIPMDMPLVLKMNSHLSCTLSI